MRKMPNRCSAKGTQHLESCSCTLPLAGQLLIGCVVMNKMRFIDFRLGDVVCITAPDPRVTRRGLLHIQRAARTNSTVQLNL